MIVKARRLITATGTLLALVLATAACSGGGDPKTSPSPSGPTGNGSLPPTNATGGSGGSIRLTKGTAHVEFTGGIKSTSDLPLDPQATIFNPPPAGFTGSWKSASETVGLGGTAQLGTRKTGPLLVFTFVRTGADSIESGISNKGECTVTMTQANRDGVKGTVECKNWKTSNKTINLSATFEGAP